MAVLLEECVTWNNVVIIVLLGCLLFVWLLLFFVFVVRVGVLCVYSDMEEWPMDKYLELKKYQSIIHLVRIEGLQF